MFGKKGEKLESPTAHVAVFIIVLVLFMVAYLLFLPQAEREKLLGTGEEYYPEGSEEEVDDEDIEREIILSVSPGFVYPYLRETDKSDIASVNLYSTTRTSPIMLADRVVVTRSFLFNNDKELVFDLDDNDLGNLGLFFNTGDANGNLIVELNGKEIYEGRVRGGELPINLPMAYLKRFDNKLNFRASHPGLFILSTNRFTLKDVQLIKQVQLENKVEMRNFVVDKVEGVQSGELSFFINCLKIKGEQGTLRVGLNGRNVYVGRVVCDAGQVDLDLLENFFDGGINTLSFEIDKGEYVLEHVRLEVDVEERKVPQYFFAVDDKEGEYVLRIDFEETDEIKRATVTINGDNLYIADYRNTYRKDVTSKIREGENYIKVIAKNEFVINLLEIEQE